VRDDLDAAYAQIVHGQHLYFRLRANVTKKLATQQQSNGKRVAITESDDQVAWLLRKAQQCGFALFVDPFAVDHYAVTVIDEGKLHGTKRNTGAVKRLVHAAVRFEGRLIVVDAEVFRGALHFGIGPAKAYGFGLLSVSPV
jgi:CRISPR system Cascade subunit CasE